MKKQMLVLITAASVSMWSLALAQDHKEEPKKEAPKSAKPAEPAKPAQPVKPTQPAKPADGAKPGEKPAGADAMEMPKQVPGPEHKRLADMVGTWNVEQRSWWHLMGAPEGTASEPMIGHGTYKFASTLDGLAVVGDYEVKDEQGTFKGHCFSAWNPTTKQYQGYWMDVYSDHGPDKWTATYDEATKTMTTMVDCMGMDGKPAKMKISSKHESPDKMVDTFFMAGPDGKEMKSMELTLTRAK